MNELRKVLVRLGIVASAFVYVDDWLLGTMSYDSTLLAMQRFEETLELLGFVNATHKQRGPAQQIEFSGHVLDFERARVAVKASRCAKLVRCIDEVLLSGRAA